MTFRLLLLLRRSPHACPDDGLRHRVSAGSPSEVNAAEQIAGTNNKFTWQVDYRERICHCRVFGRYILVL